MCVCVWGGINHKVPAHVTLYEYKCESLIAHLGMRRSTSVHNCYYLKFISVNVISQV